METRTVEVSKGVDDNITCSNKFYFLGKNVSIKQVTNNIRQAAGHRIKDQIQTTGNFIYQY